MSVSVVRGVARTRFDEMNARVMRTVRRYLGTIATRLNTTTVTDDVTGRSSRNANLTVANPVHAPCFLLLVPQTITAPHVFAMACFVLLTTLLLTLLRTQPRRVTPFLQLCVTATLRETLCDLRGALCGHLRHPPSHTR